MGDHSGIEVACAKSVPRRLAGYRDSPKGHERLIRPTVGGMRQHIEGGARDFGQGLKRVNCRKPGLTVAVAALPRDGPASVRNVG
jgi:hypothetical protein